MSKGNLFLGFGRGAVGDVVFSHYSGEQVARARNRSPKNPKTPLQLMQRTILKTVSGAYSLLRPICDHSFQGFGTGTPNQSRFQSLNIDRLRLRIADLIDNPVIDDILTSDYYNFAPKVSPGTLYNSYQVSEGSIPRFPLAWNQSDGVWSFSPDSGSIPASPGTMTYQQFIDGMGLQRGDQLTFLVAYVNDGSEPDDIPGVFTDLKVRRLILEPSDGNYDGAMIGIDDTDILNPNSRNEGVVFFEPQTAEGGSTITDFTLFIDGSLPSGDAGSNHAMAAMAVIVSRNVGGIWQRSTANLVLRPYEGTSANRLRYDHGEYLLGNAVLSFMDSAASSLYLNQARD